MIEIKVENKISKVKAQGDTISVVAELGSAIRDIYSALYRQDVEAAESFKSAMKIALLNGSTVWKPSRDTNGIVMVWPKDAPSEREGGNK